MDKIGYIDLDNKSTSKDVTISKNHNGKRLHRFTIPFGVTRDHACKLQMDLGYHPSGYGFYGFTTSPTETTWSCGDSCD